VLPYAEVAKGDAMSKSARFELVTVATAWGPAEGGVNSFNYDLTIALSRCAMQRVACLVPSASPEEVQDATGNRVTLLIRPELFKSGESVGDLRSIVGESVCWIGHDIHTGDLAYSLCAALGGTVSVIMHQSYSDYETVKHPTRGHSEKEGKQRTLFKKAHHVFAVGPLLFERLSDLRKDAIELIPGIYDVKPDIPRNNLIAVVVGRLDPENSLMKGTVLACEAIAEAVRKVRDAGVPSARLSHPILKLIGVGGDLQQETSQIKSRIEETAEQCISVSVKPFLTRTELREELRTVNLCFMLSWHEGFGLAGWEAIGAGIPLILTKNSGLYKTLENVGAGATGCVYGVDIRGSLDHDQPFHNEDLRVTSRAVAEIASRLDKWIEHSEYLRSLLASKFTWDHTARHLLKAMNISFRPLPSEEQPVRGAYVAFSEGLEEARDKQRLQVATVLYETGFYQRALDEVVELDTKQTTQQIRNEQQLLKCEIMLRLNRHTEVCDLAKTLSTEFQNRNCWRDTTSAKGILNTAMRALGEYSEARIVAQECYEISASHCPTQIGKSSRDIARCIALLGGPEDEGLKWANLSLALATNNLDKAKCLLAVGEVLRHTGNLPDATTSYSESVGWANAVGHYDCLLWAALGLSDCYFLQGDFKRSAECLLRVKPIVEDTERSFPLETLHYELSTLALSYANGSEVSDEAWENVVRRYDGLGVGWPSQYVSQIRGRDFNVPKKL
jgi:glycosyltransferase involved in cell wall biosynthesis